MCQAIELGYRLIDTAENYPNERAWARVAAQRTWQATSSSSPPKFNKEWHGVDGARAAFEASAGRAGR